MLTRHTHKLFVMPAVVFIGAMMLFPVGYTAWLSLHEWSGSSIKSPQWVGIGNYVDLLTTDSRFGHAVLRTFFFTGIAVPVELALGLAVALLICAAVL